MREAERWHHQHVDARDNADSRLPADERVSWPGFWITEIYGPSHAPALEEGVDRLATRGGGLFPREDAGEWIRNARSWTGGYMNLGTIAQPGKFIGHSQRVELPDEFAYVSAQVKQMAPGVTILICQFVLQEAHRGEIETVLRTDFATTAEPLRHSGGHSIVGPEHHKQDRIAEIRDHYRSRARDWVADQVPVNAYAQDVGAAEGTVFTEEDLSDATCSRHKAVERWFVEQQLKAPSKVAVANKVVALRGEVRLLDRRRSRTLRKVHAAAFRALGIA